MRIHFQVAHFAPELVAQFKSESLAHFHRNTQLEGMLAGVKFATVFFLIFFCIQENHQNPLRWEIEQKRLFNGLWLLFTQEPFECLELKSERESQWQTVRHANGLRVQIFSNQADCIMERNRIFSRF